MQLPAAESAFLSEPALGGRIGVVDIGSNSIRLVVFDRLGRTPSVVFNEKVLCGLGRGLTTTGSLDDEAMALALANLARFALLARKMEVAALEVVATAAVREAANGQAFVAAVQRRCGFVPRILSGREEAELAACGVLSAVAHADGLVGDLGGGSLELVRLNGGMIRDHETLPLGPLRLADWRRGRPPDADAAVDGQLRNLPWLEKVRGRSLYAVGGSWRAIARLHMERRRYPLRVLHNYSIGFDEAVEMAAFIAARDAKSLAKTTEVGRERLELIPLAAFVLGRLLLAAAPARLTFSALGLREGILFSRLAAPLRKLDPLIAECRQVGQRYGRFGALGDELSRWIAPLFPDDGAAERRQRLAVCLLGDVAWREHPDYRAEQAFLEVLRLPLIGADHPTRAAIALGVYYRYTGKNGRRTGLATALLDPAAVRRMKIVGQAARLGLTISGGVPGLLGPFRLVDDGRTLTLKVAAADTDLVGEMVHRRFAALAQAVGREPRIARAG